MLDKTKEPLLERVKSLLKTYSELDQRADAVIDEHVAEMAPKCPGTPLGVIRCCEFDAIAQGYSRVLALKHLRQKLGGV